ncbi:MAG: nucleotide exchange factor GrpE [Prevotella sp.]|nr:nucleotide exchange factor GrpE [Prevotella sp.]MBO5641873.1 nucleotide exchange factor GrpE [Prevotella sp.]
MKKEDINTVAEENIKDNINNGVDENVDNVEQTEQTEQTEETVEDNTAASTEETAEEQVDPLEKALAEIEELKKQALYKQAEFENYRKRTIKEKADLILGGGEKTITAILPVLDDFERALADKSDDPAAIREGMQLIYNKFVKTLEGLGVKKIETENADFNVDFHESIALVPGMGEDKKGKVIDCVQTGYTLNDKVIRFAKVAVGQ